MQPCKQSSLTSFELAMRYSQSSVETLSPLKQLGCFWPFSPAMDNKLNHSLQGLIIEFCLTLGFVSIPATRLGLCVKSPHGFAV